MDNHQMPFPLNTPLPFYGVDNNCFKLGENVYEAVEDPDDGYRSYLGSVEVRHDSQIFFRTPLDTVVVETVKRGDLFEGYAVVSTEDRHVWLEFGTEAFDTYYPGFVFNYTPRPPARVDVAPDKSCYLCSGTGLIESGCREFADPCGLCSGSGKVTR